MRNEENGAPYSLVEKKKTEICERIFDRLLKSPAAIQHSLSHPSFKDQLQAHFNRLPYRYSLDVNVERAEVVVEHKRLLELAKIPENRPAFSVRAIQNSSHLRQSMPLNTRWSMGSLVMPTGEDNLERSSGVSLLNSLPIEDDLFAYGGNSFPWQSGVLPSPSYGSSPNLESLALETNSPLPDNENYSNGGLSSTKLPHKPLHEVTFSTMDKPKLLSKLSTVLADVGLNIREAHAFCTVDGYSLDVFVVDGWPTEDTEELEQALTCVIANEEKKFWSTLSPFSSPTEQTAMAKLSDMNRFKIPTDGSDDWEIDFSQIKLNHKVASGSFGDLFRGTYCGQEVAIKMLKPECLSEDIQKEFAHEVFIMRKVRHRNVVQFIGACTKVPNLCLVTEFMVGGSVYDYLHKQKRVFNLPTLLRVAIDISRGMDYLHQNNIVHRDLKAANLLMNENEVVKVADFGVARVQTESGIMTAETGTYRWMAPEVIEHKPYDHKADVFSFGIVLWELITGKLPYDDLTPLQAAVGVVQKGLRPAIPEDTRDGLAVLLERCWQQDPALRPDFSEITAFIQSLLSEKKVRGKKHDEILGRDKIAKKLHVEGEGPCVENKLSVMDCKEHNEDMNREYFVELLNQSSLNNLPPSMESFTPPQNDGLYDEDAKYCLEMRYNKFISSSSFNQFDA